MIPDESVDFAFSFDSLVHAEEDVIESYLNQLHKKLKRNGTGFLHHSNLGAYKTYFTIIKKMPERARKVLGGLGIIEKDFLVHNRTLTMTAAKFRNYTKKVGLKIISQELINWFTKRLIDCIPVFTRTASDRRCPGTLMQNSSFTKESDYIKRVAELYKLSKSNQSP